MATIRVNGQGLFFSAPAATTISYSQKSASGTYVSGALQYEWTGSNLSYTSGIYTPTGGTVTSFTVKDGLGVEQFSISGVSYQIQANDNFSQLTDIFVKMVAGSDNWTGTAGNELFVMGEGNDTFDGGAGLDTVQIQNLSSYFSINQVKNGFTTTFNVPGNRLNGQVDSFTNVERLQFNDKIVALDLDGNAGQAYRLYQAAFNRTPDKAGLGYWIGQLDKGAENLNHVAAGFVNSAEFKQMYGSNISDNTFLTALYNNVLHRNPDQAGFDYWNGRVAAGMTRSDILASFSESTENIAQVIGQISHGIEYIPFG
ncbi:DUF4214 domain-containing protein [Undibacterium sp. Ji50W]|uniref:DUF4214 domain-containing protein n=1 Tax=Undibacterium sp. Ji50W TaxID=3413041 RepID=UPI003BF124EF